MARMLDRLVREQEADGRNCHAVPDGPAIATDPHYLAETIEAGQSPRNYGLSWGEPAMICQLVHDKCCPKCGAERGGSFDVGVEQGRIFGARCGMENGGCSWAFGIEIGEASENPQTQRPKGGRGIRGKKGGKSKPRMGQTVPVKRAVAEVPQVVSEQAPAMHESVRRPRRAGSVRGASHQGPP